MAKYTDDQIKKALECCGDYGCEECSMNFTSDDIGCELYVGQLYLLALELVNRQEAEIERLNKEVDRLSQIILYRPGQMADAIKEFAERLCEGRVSNDPVVIAVKVELEMVGESNVD